MHWAEDPRVIVQTGLRTGDGADELSTGVPPVVRADEIRVMVAIIHGSIEALFQGLTVYPQGISR